MIVSCARAATDHAAAAPPSSVMNSRRLVGSSEAQDRTSWRSNQSRHRTTGRCTSNCKNVKTFARLHLRCEFDLIHQGIIDNLFVRLTRDLR